MNEASTEQLEESLRGHESLSEIDDFNGLAKKFIEHGETIKTLQGDSEGKVAIPKEDASDEERQEFSKKMSTYNGVPESIEGYEVVKPDSLPEGMQFDDTLSDLMLTTLLKEGAPKALVQTLFNEFNKYHVDIQNKYNQIIKEGNEKRMEVLKQEYGTKFEAKNKGTFIALNKFAEHVKVPEGFGGIEGFKKWMGDSGLDTDPIFNWMWSKVFEFIGDDTFVKGGGVPQSGKDALDEMYPSMTPK